jgi:hypothetical protein
MSQRRDRKGKTHSKKVADSTDWEWDPSRNQWFWLTTNPWNVQERIYYEPETSITADATTPRTSDSKAACDIFTPDPSSYTASERYGATETLEGSLQNLNISTAAYTNNPSSYTTGRDITSDPGKLIL